MSLHRGDFPTEDPGMSLHRGGFPTKDLTKVPRTAPRIDRSALRLGDSVVLASGGPRMTAIAVEEHLPCDRVGCRWVGEDGTVYRAWVPFACLAPWGWTE